MALPSIPANFSVQSGNQQILVSWDLVTGATSYIGLMARQAAQQGGNLQQQAAGQGAALQAQQSLGALNQLGGMAGQQVGQGLNAYGQAAGVAGQQAGNQLAAQNAYNQAALQGRGQDLAAIQNAQQMNVQQQMGANQLNATQAMAQSQRQAGMFGGVLNAAGTVGAALLAKGGQVQSSNHYANGGNVMPPNSGGPQSALGRFMAGSQPMMMAQGGKVPAMVSPGERYIPPQQVEAIKNGTNPMKLGEKIPGNPKVSGAKDSYKNDTVPKTLEEGGIVIPRSVTQSKDAERKAQEFVAAVFARKGKLK